MYKLSNINSQYCQSLQEGARLVDMDIKHAWIYVGKLEDLAEVWERTISEQDSGQNGFIGLVMLNETPVQITHSLCPPTQPCVGFYVWAGYSKIGDIGLYMLDKGSDPYTSLQELTLWI